MLEPKLPREKFWAMSKGGKLRCPECGAIVVEDMELDCREVEYTCTAIFCGWHKTVDLREIGNAIK